MKLLYKIVILIFIITISLLIITNPSVKAFKEYLGTDSYRGLKRVKNYLVYSEYAYKDQKFKGYLANFYPLPPKKVYRITDEQIRKTLQEEKLPTLEELNSQLGK